MDQEKVFALAMAGNNLFITGNAGTGKTYILNKIIQAFREEGKIVAKTASTGIASTHLNGTTIHSWAGIGIKEKLTEEDLYKLRNNKFSKERISEADVLVIDEISMLHDYRLDMVDVVCRFIRDPRKPFGGLQIIVCGDFFQLPPVNKDDAKNYSFDAKCWPEAGFLTCYLEKIYRQNADDVLVEILNAIRRNGITADHKKVLDSLCKNTDNIDKSINLFCKNVNVDILNSTELVKLKTESHIFKMEESGLDFKVQQLKKNILAAETLILKEGAKVMVIANDHNRKIVNGTLGEVVDLSEAGDGVIQIREYKNNRVIAINKWKWEIEEYDVNLKKDKVIASVTQYPLRLAWALTVHKSQGASFDFATIDLSDTFIENMGYVALSRLTSISGLHLVGYNKIALHIDDYILEKDSEFKAQSEANDKGIE